MVQFQLKRDTRLNDNIKEAIPLSEDMRPLYSSLAKDKMFKPPVTAKDVLNKKR